MSGVDSGNRGSLRTPAGEPQPAIMAGVSGKSPVESPAENSSLIGQTIDKRFRIVSPLGRGGMSEVYKAEHLILQKLVAIKILHQGQLGQANGMERFQQEARAVSSLDHPNIVKVYAFGCAEDKRFYLVMDYLDGMSLSELLEAERVLDWKRVLALAIQIAGGLSHAHERGIIHRDLKPSNIIVQRNESGAELPKIVDFGVARLTLESGKEMRNLTLDGNTCGSPPYMSPEQCRGESVDQRSDVYSFGCMLYELLSGKRPFYGASSIEVMTKHVEESVRLFKSVCPGIEIPQSLEAIVRKCLSKNVDLRYQSMGELEADLRLIGTDGADEARLKDSLAMESAQLKKKHAYLQPLAIGLSVVLIAGAVFIAYKYSGELNSMSLRAEIAKLAPGDPRYLDRLAGLTQQLFDADLKADNQNAAMKDLKVLLKQVNAMPLTPQRAKYLRKIATMYEGLGKREAAHMIVLQEISELEKYIEKCGQEKNAPDYEAACIAVLKLCGNDTELQDRALGKTNMLVSLYLTQNNYAKAEKMARRGLEIIEHKAQRDSLPKILALHYLSSALMAQAKLLEAQSCLETALALSVEGWGKDHKIARSSAHKLKECFLLEGKNSEAEKLSRQYAAPEY